MSDSDGRIFQALVHPIRRSIICYLKEKRYASLTDLLKHIDIRDHGKLSFHLKALGNYRKNGSRRGYHLIDRGLLAAELIALTRDRDFIVCRRAKYEEEEK